MNIAPGIDWIGIRILRELSKVISDSVVKLYNKSLSTSGIPGDWKLSNVTRVFKNVK